MNKHQEFLDYLEDELDGSDSMLKRFKEVFEEELALNHQEEENENKN